MMTEPDDQPLLRPWQQLSHDEQTALRMAYQLESDKMPLTCSLDIKTERFSAWLAEKGVAFSMDDLRRR